MAWRGSFSRTLMSTASSSLRSSPPPLPRLRPPPISSPCFRSSPRLSFNNARNLGELRCAQSLLPMLAGTQLTSHLTVNVRAYSELSHGTFCRTCSIASSLGGMEKIGDAQQVQASKGSTKTFQ